MLLKIFHVFISLGLISLTLPPKSEAESFLQLPQPGTLVALSPAYTPALLKGLTVHPDNPLMFDFIVDAGQDQIQGEALKKEGQKVIKYFLAGLAIPENHFWVNLSPFEGQRIIPETLGQTDMGRDMLAQDYILKQLSASLISPEQTLGQSFWEKVYIKAKETYGTHNIPVNTFNKIWITADRAQVYERGRSAFVADSHLKVMLEEDYVALKRHPLPHPPHKGEGMVESKIIRELILPEIEKEVNEGKNFAPLW